MGPETYPDPNMMQIDPQMADMAAANSETIAAVILGMMGFFLIFVLISYVFSAIIIMKIAKKLGVGDLWMAWIPILQVVPLLKAADKELWWIILLFIPGVNIVISVLLFMEISKRLGKPDWWGILTIVPFVNLVILAILAFSSSAQPVGAVEEKTA